MNVEIMAKRLELTGALNEYIARKLSSIGKMVKGLDDDRGSIRTEVEVERTTKHHKHGEVMRAEINLILPKKRLRAEAVDDDIRLALSEAVKTLEREIKTYKGASKTKIRSARRSKAK